MFIFAQLLVFLPALIYARPGNVGGAVSVSATGGGAPFYVEKGGNVGVDFAGYKASAGLGGLLTGNVADGGLHAEAETPHGQGAGAGIGGSVSGIGKSGGAYAGATGGGGVSADAGLAGSSSFGGSFSSSYAGASSGSFDTHVTKVKTAPRFKATAVAPAPAVYHKEVEVVAEQPKPQTTFPFKL